MSRGVWWRHLLGTTAFWVIAIAVVWVLAEVPVWLGW